MASKTPRKRQRSYQFGDEVREAVGMLSDKSTFAQGLSRVKNLARLYDGRILLIGHFHNAIARPHLLQALGKPENARGTFEVIASIIGGKTKTSRNNRNWQLNLL